MCTRYRDLEEIMAERGLSVDHTTIFRWIQHYAPELDQRCRVHLKAYNDSWKVDETYTQSEQRRLLETLLVIPEGERQTPLDRLRRSPTRVTAPSLVQALHRIEAVRVLGVRGLDLSFVSSGRLKALARYVLSARIQTLSHMTEDRRNRR